MRHYDCLIDGLEQPAADGRAGYDTLLAIGRAAGQRGGRQNSGEGKSALHGEFLVMSGG